MLLAHVHNLAGDFGGGNADFADSTEEELLPTFPIAAVANGHQPVVVFGFASLEKSN